VIARRTVVTTRVRRCCMDPVSWVVGGRDGGRTLRQGGVVATEIGGRTTRVRMSFRTERGREKLEKLGIQDQGSEPLNSTDQGL
jgi:hypothetical protein